MNADILVIGILISLLVIEVTGLAPGGIIVPGYLALFFATPLRLVGTAFAALAAYAAYRLLSHRLILFGSRRFAAMVLLGAAAAYAGSAALPRIWPASVELRVVAWVVPGLLADRFERQGVAPTAALALASGGATYAAARLLEAL